MYRQIVVEVKKQQELIPLPLTTCIVHCHFVAEPPLKDGGEEGGAERESQTWQGQPVLGEVQVGLVGAEGDEGRSPC